MHFVERWLAWRAMRGYRELTASSPEGSRVRVSGVVRILDETVIAPLSGHECVLARSQLRPSGYVSPPLLLLQTRPFIVQTSQLGDVVVDGGAVLFGVPPVELGERDRERQMAFSTRFGLSPKVPARFEEIRVAAGDRITVGGVLMRDLNPEPPRDERAFREQTAPRARLTGSDDHPLVIVAGR